MSDPYVTVNTITLGYVSLSDSLSISISFIYLIPLSFSAVILPPFLRHSCLLLSLCSLSSPPSPLTYLFPLSVPASVPLPFPLCLPPFPLSLSLSFSALFLTLFLNSLALFSLSLSLKRSLSLSHTISLRALRLESQTSSHGGCLRMCSSCTFIYFNTQFCITALSPCPPLRTPDATQPQPFILLLY